MIGFQVAGSCLGACAGFVAKQVFSYQFLSPIKERLREIITQVATNKIGALAARIIGNELAMVCSIPVTMIFSDLVFGAVKKCVEAICSLAGKVILQPKSISQKSEPMWSKILHVVRKVVSVASFYLSRAYFCHYGMPLVEAGTQFFLRNIIVLPAFMPAFGAGFVISAAAMILTPPVTFFLADTIGFAVSETSDFLLKKTISLLS